MSTSCKSCKSGQNAMLFEVDTFFSTPSHKLYISTSVAATGSTQQQPRPPPAYIATGRRLRGRAGGGQGEC
ncbi:MAG: hypothetical protein JRD93_18495 [Deltaproteobacteria bacterium]|nr:hypothetical protein [Deltaproteobacteria bacterium]